jgi:hypothetical protein
MCLRLALRGMKRCEGFRVRSIIRYGGPKSLTATGHTETSLRQRIEMNIKILFKQTKICTFVEKWTQMLACYDVTRNK